MALEAEIVKKDFPIFDREVKGKRLVYLDSAASSQKPSVVIDAITNIYETTYANVHRGVYALSEAATALYEGSRQTVARFINAPSPSEIIYGKNVTEMINLVAYSWGRKNLRSGDAILLTELEHHANLVPWLILAEERGIELRYLSVDDDGMLDLSNLDEQLIGVKLVSFAGVSNVLGTINPVRQLVDAAHAVGAVVLIDAAQWTPHLPTDVQALGCDLFAFTGHKMLGPTGIGVLWGKRELLEEMPPFLGGGDMILDVRLDGFTPNELPWKFEAGTPPFPEAIGLGAAIDYLTATGMESIRHHEVQLTAYALQRLRDQFGDQITIWGPPAPADRSGNISFSFGEIHPHDLAQVLDQEGVCIRAGHHCAKPLMRRLGVSATARASFYVYNDEADVEALVDALVVAARMFS